MHREVIAFRVATTVVPFPLCARTADVRRAALLLTIKRLTAEAAMNRWVRIMDRLARDLEACGFDSIVVAIQLCAFEDAVNDEIARRTARSIHH